MPRAGRRLYPLLLRLYPAEFRDEYGDDMVLLFDDLVAEHGIFPTVRRTAVDLMVTVPRYRLESAMNESRVTPLLTACISLLTIVGLAAPMIGLLWVGPAALALALGLAVANRSRLARAIRTPRTATRGSRLRGAGVCALVFAASAGAWAVAVSDGSASTPSLLVSSLVGTMALVGTLGFLGAALFTPRVSTGVPPATT